MISKSHGPISFPSIEQVLRKDLRLIVRLSYFLLLAGVTGCEVGELILPVQFVGLIYHMLHRVYWIWTLAQIHQILGLIYPLKFKKVQRCISTINTNNLHIKYEKSKYATLSLPDGWVCWFVDNLRNCVDAHTESNYAFMIHPSCDVDDLKYWFIPTNLYWACN